MVFSPHIHNNEPQVTVPAGPRFVPTFLIFPSIPRIYGPAANPERYLLLAPCSPRAAGMGDDTSRGKCTVLVNGRGTYCALVRSRIGDIDCTE